MNKILMRTESIKRYFKGKNKTTFKAVDGISFTLHKGEVISFVGPNGAGKTTLIRSISGYLVPTSGKIEIMGLNLAKKPREARQKMGVVFGGDRGFYNSASAYDNLAFFARLLNVKEKDIKNNVLNALEIVNLLNVKDKYVGSFSKGMMQRLHIARGLVNKPEILMLDEPTAGLDVESVYTVRALIKNLKEAGHGIILTSHDMADIETLADTIHLIGGGKLVFSGNTDQIKEFAGVDANTSLEKAYLAIAPKLKRRL